MKCRISGQELTQFLDLGNQFVSNFVLPGEHENGAKSPLRLGIGELGLAQLLDTVDPGSMYEEYWYRSGVNERMRRDLGEVVHAAKNWVRLRLHDTVLDIACNDFTLLKSPVWGQTSLRKIGIDPSDVTLASYDDDPSITFYNTYFSADAYWRVAEEKAKVVTCCAMFYDLDNPLAFLSDVRSVLHPEGVFVLQLSYTPLMLRQNAFDNIGHEHLCYYTFQILSDALESTGFSVVDVEINDVNCGSMRVVARHENAKETAPLHIEEIGMQRVCALLLFENALSISEEWELFANRVKALKTSTLDWLMESKRRGKRVVGYGASTKGNTLLQTYGITPHLLDCIVERDPKKVGRVTVGTGIPIISEEQAREEKIDYLFVLPWTFIQSMRERETALQASGAKFVVPLPELRVLD